MNIVSVSNPSKNELAYSLAIHGGAAAQPDFLSPEEKVAVHRGLKKALDVGQEILVAGGSALDAVCIAVVELENNPLFNAAHGAALNSAGEAELDAAVMTGDGEAGAVAGVRFARNPILAARAVMERTPHVLIIDPSIERMQDWQLETVERGHFVIKERLDELDRLRGSSIVGACHGTVGAVARDLRGDVAAGTSTGGTANQEVGRVGDTPIIGAGTFADSNSIAISCTGEGEYFLREVLAHQMHARVKYLGESLEQSARGVLDRLEVIGGQGGLIAIDSHGQAVIGFNSKGMYCGYIENGTAITHV